MVVLPGIPASDVNHFSLPLSSFILDLRFDDG